MLVLLAHEGETHGNNTVAWIIVGAVCAVIVLMGLAIWLFGRIQRGGKHSYS